MWQQTENVSIEFVKRKSGKKMAVDMNIKLPNFVVLYYSGETPGKVTKSVSICFQSITKTRGFKDGAGTLWPGSSKTRVKITHCTYSKLFKSRWKFWNNFSSV